MKKKKILRSESILTPLLEFRRTYYESPVDIPGYALSDSRCMICKLDSYWQCSPFRKEWCSWVNRRKFEYFVYVT